MVNEYSSLWYELFCRDIPAAQAHREIEFLRRQLPRDSFPRILDLCCGEGRHANELARLGYQVTGIDINAAALEVARVDSASSAVFLQIDMREAGALGQRFESVICM